MHKFGNRLFLLLGELSFILATRIIDQSLPSEGYVLVGESLWSYVGTLSPKDKTQLEERLRRVAGPSNTEAPGVPPTPSAGPVSRIATGVPRPGSRIGGIPRPASPAVGASRLARPTSPARSAPSVAHAQEARSSSPALTSRLPKAGTSLPTSPHLARPKSFLPSRLGPARGGASGLAYANPVHTSDHALERPALRTLNGVHPHHSSAPSNHRVEVEDTPPTPSEPDVENEAEEDAVALTISKILSSDPSRSVDALKQIQRILKVSPDEGPAMPQYRELSDHTEGLIETIDLQMGHCFDDTTSLTEHENFRLAKHLIQTINAFCDHPVLAESLQVDILTNLFKQLTLRLLQTDESELSEVKDLSRFINMIILRLFSTCRRMTVLRLV